MSLSNAVKAFGTFLKIGDGAGSESFTTIAEVKSINGLKMSAKQEDVTSHSSTDPWRQFISTLIDGGTVAFGINFIPTEATQDYSAGVLRDFVNRTRRNFELVFPDGGSTTWGFPANIQDFGVDAPVDGVLSASITLKVAGKPTLA
jgi:predicted secreted protein